LAIGGSKMVDVASHSMKQSTRKRIAWAGLELMRPILVPTFWLLEQAYKLFFARSDLRSSMEREQRFAQEVRANLSILFHDYAGTIVADEATKHPRPFNYAVVVVQLEDISFRFVRGRGEFRVQVKPNPAPSDWEELPLVLHLIDQAFELREFASLPGIEAALRPRIGQLKKALSADGYANLHQHLADVHKRERAVIKQWETEINRKLYDDK
jgi:hypothetical protein